MRDSGLASTTAIALALAGCGGDFELPPEIASSTYLVYHTDVDASVICMDDLLAREDQFIERTATMIGVKPPSEPIHFVWDLDQDGKEPWACDGNTNCFKLLADDGRSVVVSNSPTNHHELVHAIDAQALGTDVHRTLVEGLAEYLGSLRTSGFDPGQFPAAFTAMLDRAPVPSDYALAMHFVGSIFALHGAAKYRELRATTPPGARAAEFSATFESVYRLGFDATLEQIGAERLNAVDRFPGCDDGIDLSWTGEGLLEATIHAACGDPWFFGAGLVAGRVGFFGYYVVDVPQPGEYALTVGPAADAPAPLRGFLSGCSFDLLDSQALSLSGETDSGPLKSGKHVLLVAYPPRAEARGAAQVRLEYVGPPAPP